MADVTRQPLPTWMSWVSYTVPDATGGVSISYSILELPLTYYGPWIPLPSDGTWVYGGLSSPAPTTTTPAPTSASSTASLSPTPTPSSTLAPFTTTTSIPTSTTASATSGTSSTYLTTSPPPTSTLSPSATTSSSSSSSPSSLSNSPTNSLASSQTSTPTTSSSSTASPSTTPVPSHHRISRGSLAAIVIGSLIAAFFILGAMFLCMLAFRKRRHRRNRDSHYTDGTFHSDPGDDEDWEIVGGSTDPQERSGGGRSGDGRFDSSGTGTGSGRRTNTNGNDTSDPQDLPTPTSSLFVAVPAVPRSRTSRNSANERTSSWPPWRRQPAEAQYHDVAPDEVVEIGIPQRPRSLAGAPPSRFSGHTNSDPPEENEGFLADSAGAGPGPSSKGYAQRAREAVASRRAREARSSYVPGTAFFTWFRKSWASSRGTPTRVNSRVDELGNYRPPSQKSGRGAAAAAAGTNVSQKSQKSSLIPDENGGSQRRVPSQHQVGSQRTQNSSSEKSSLVPPGGTDDSPPTPTSEQFPAPPPTFPEVHAIVRQRSERSVLGPRPSSNYSQVSGTTAYWDAIDFTPLPTPLYPDLPPLRHVDSGGSLRGRTGVPLSPTSPGGRPIMRTPRSQSSLRSVAYAENLEDPPPLPSVSLVTPRDNTLQQQQIQDPQPSPPPAYSTDWSRLAPPGLEEYRRYTPWVPSPRSNPSTDSDRSRSRSVGLPDLEEEPPSAEGAWRRLAAYNEPLPFEDSPPGSTVPLGVFGRQRSSGPRSRAASPYQTGQAYSPAGSLSNRGSPASRAAEVPSNQSSLSNRNLDTDANTVPPMDPMGLGIVRRPASHGTFGPRSPGPGSSAGHPSTGAAPTPDPGDPDDIAAANAGIRLVRTSSSPHP